jgi:hypothetical protein
MKHSRLPLLNRIGITFIPDITVSPLYVQRYLDCSRQFIGDLEYRRISNTIIRFYGSLDAEADTAGTAIGLSNGHFADAKKCKNNE